MPNEFDVFVTSADVALPEELSFFASLFAQALVEADSERLCSPTISSTFLDRLCDLCEQLKLDQTKSHRAPTAHILLRAIEHNIRRLLNHDHSIGCTCAASPGLE